MLKKLILVFVLLTLTAPGTWAQYFAPGTDWYNPETCILGGCVYLTLPFFFTRLDFSVTDAGNFFSLDIPYLNFSLFGDPDDVVQFSIGGMVKWGLTEFSVDFEFFLGIVLFPFMEAFDQPWGRIVNLHVRGIVGTFFLNNVLLRAEGGIDFEVMVIDEHIGFFLGIDAFIQGNWPVYPFIHEDSWFINAMGVNFSFGCKANFD